MSAQLHKSCGVCERPLSKATRVEAGVRYCPTCYSQSFKRLMCGGCGMFKRLLVAQDDPRCQACFASKPCIRCRRRDRPVGKLTEQGPVCNSCYSYFIEPSPCEVCNEPSRRLSVLRTADGDKKACPRCHRTNQHTCAFCRKHRLCEQTRDGRWRCRLCAEVGEVTCAICFAPMAAGNGKRCQACYWAERCERSAVQLVELLHSKRARDAFSAFATWLQTQGSAQRAALRLTRHAEFFVMLDGCSAEAWTSEFLLKRFGTATLRRYEMPVRWFHLHANIELPAQDKARDSDLRRVRTAVVMMPEGSLARELLEAFQRELERRRDTGKLTERSMRLAFRPAVALLAEEDPRGERVPGQAALERYLAATPGQRAAVSTFLGFLKARRGIELRLPTKPSAQVRQSLEKQIAALITSPVDADQTPNRWALLALRYFHHLSATDAKTIYKESKLHPGSGGTVFTFRGQGYWIPAEPTMLIFDLRNKGAQY
jgi:hypothetical protein